MLVIYCLCGQDIFIPSERSSKVNFKPKCSCIWKQESPVEGWERAGLLPSFLNAPAERIGTVGMFCVDPALYPYKKGGEKRGGLKRCWQASIVFVVCDMCQISSDPTKPSAFTFIKGQYLWIRAAQLNWFTDMKVIMRSGQRKDEGTAVKNSLFWCQFFILPRPD